MHKTIAAASVVALVAALSIGPATAAGTQDQLTGCVDRGGKFSKLREGPNPTGGKCPKGSNEEHLQTLPDGAHSFGGAINLGTAVSFNLTIPFSDRFVDSHNESGEVDFVKHGPLTVSFGIYFNDDNLSWIRVRGGVSRYSGHEGLSDVVSEGEEALIGGNVDGGNVFVMEPVLVSGGGGYYIRVDRSFFLPQRAIVGLTFFTPPDGEQPKLIPYKGNNVYETDFPNHCELSGAC